MIPEAQIRNTGCLVPVGTGPIRNENVDCVMRTPGFRASCSAFGRVWSRLWRPSTVSGVRGLHAQCIDSNWAWGLSGVLPWVSPRRTAPFNRRHFCSIHYCNGPELRYRRCNEADLDWRVSTKHLSEADWTWIRLVVGDPEVDAR